MIPENYFYLNVFLLVVGTLVIRGFFIALSHRMKLSGKTTELFSFIPAAVLPAFILPATFFHQGTIEVLQGKERFVALLVAVTVTVYRRSTLLTIGTGLGLLYLLRYFFS